MIRNLFAVLVFVMMASGAHARFSVFENNDSCVIASSANLVAPYSPTTKAPFKGGPGWTKKTVPQGGACLSDAYVMEDGVPVKGKSVYVAEGFVYHEHTSSGAHRMHDCSNPFGGITLLGKKAEPLPAPPQVATAPVQPCTDCNITVTKNVTEIINANRICRLDGKEVAIVNGKCEGDEVVLSLPVRVETKIDASCGTCGTTVTQRVHTPAVPPVKAAQGCEPNCVPTPTARVIAQEAAPHGICGIRAVDQNRKTVGLIQLDNFNGKVRIVRVAEWRGRPTHRPVVTGLQHSPARDCDVDQAAVEQHWPQVIKMLELPLDCNPAKDRRQI